MMNYRHWGKTIYVGIPILGFLFLFQNCGEGFKTNVDQLSEIQNTDNPNNPSDDPSDPSDPGLTKTELSFASFESCRSKVAISSVVTCLQNNDVDIGTLTQAKLDTCVTSVGSTSLEIAFCLAKNGSPLQGYRELTQKDVDTCNSNVGPNNIAACLKNNGVLPFGLMQETIKTCMDAVGLENLEKCLRKNNYISRNDGISQFDINLCNKIYGSGPANIKTCLENKELWPESLMLSTYESCQTSGGFGNIAGCLRANGHLGPVVVMQNHINRCNKAVGLENISSCLNLNKWITSASSITQAVINTCAGAVGVDKIVSCLRTNGHLTRMMNQYHLNSCKNVVGSNSVVNCLQANNIHPAALTQGEIDSCVTAKGGDFGQIIKCIRVKKILPKVVMKKDIIDCNNMVGQANIYSCLQDNGYYVAGFSQANIDTCITNVTLANVAKCLRVNNFVSNIPMNQHFDSCIIHTGATTGVVGCLGADNNNISLPAAATQTEVNSCVTAVGAANIMKCLTRREHIHPIPTQNFLNLCNDHFGQANVAACLTDNGQLPPLTTQADIDTCATNVGFANVRNCLNTNNKISPTFAQLTEATGIFGQNCASCHDATHPKLNISDKTQVLSKLATSNWSANSSLLYQRINTNNRNPDNGLTRMPPDGQMPVLSREIIRYWILNQAP